MCCCHQGEKRVLVPAGARTLRKFFLMQLSVALCLHFGWGSQLNTSEMFWINISRWMISIRCRWIPVHLFLHTTHAYEALPFFCMIVSIVVRDDPGNCPSVICLPRIAV